MRLPPGLKRETEVNPPIGKAPPLSSNWAKRGPLSVRDRICHRVSGRAKECVYFVSPPVKDVYIGPGGGGNSAQAIEFPEFLLAERRTEPTGGAPPSAREKRRPEPLCWTFDDNANENQTGPSAPANHSSPSELRGGRCVWNIASLSALISTQN